MRAPFHHCSGNYPALPHKPIVDHAQLPLSCSLSPHIDTFVVSGPSSMQWNPSADSLTRHHAHFGDDFYGFWCEGCRYIVANRCISRLFLRLYHSIGLQ